MPQPISRNEVEKQILERAGTDPAFRAALLQDPKSIVEKEFGVAVPAGVSLTVHEESRNSIHLVLPPVDKLSDEELEAVAGGYCCYCSCCPP